MWLYLIVAALVVVGIGGGIFAGGIFTIVLLPLAGIVLVSGLAYSTLARGAQERENAAGSTSDLPHHPPDETGRARTSPERLADARRVHQ
jgi:hypothetical protein